MKRITISVSLYYVLVSWALSFVPLTAYFVVLRLHNDFLKMAYYRNAKDIGHLYAIKCKNADLCKNELFRIYNQKLSNTVFDRFIFPASYDQKYFYGLLIKSFEEELEKQKSLEKK